MTSKKRNDPIINSLQRYSFAYFSLSLSLHSLSIIFNLKSIDQTLESRERVMRGGNNTANHYGFGSSNHHHRSEGLTRNKAIAKGWSFKFHEIARFSKKVDQFFLFLLYQKFCRFFAIRLGLLIEIKFIDLWSNEYKHNHFQLDRVCACALIF